MKAILCILCLFSFLMSQNLKDTIIIAVENEPKRINPIYSEDHDDINSMVFSGLTRFDENMNIIPDLAKSWNISKDGLEYEFILRDDVFWHDGVKFSAEDVKFSIDAFKDSKNNSTLSVNYEDVKDVKIINDYKIKIYLYKPYPAFLDVLSYGVLPKHLLENENLNTTTFNQNPIGTGPYKFKKWKKGQYTSLIANEKYYLAKVKTKNLIVKYIPNSTTKAIELKNSAVDIALIDFSLMDQFKNDERFNILIEPSVDYRALMFNLNNEILKDKNIRIALNYMIDKQKIVKNVLKDYASVANHPIELSWANPDHFAKFNYDLKKADFYLKNSGWTKNKNGIYEKDGKELSFDIYVMSDDRLRVLLASALEYEFLKNGVKAKVIAKVSGSFDYTKTDSFLVGWGSVLDPDYHTYKIFSSSEDSDINESGWNFNHYKNKIVDETLKKARYTKNKEERKKYYKEFIQALHDDPPYLFIAYIKYPLVYDKNLKGIKQRVLGHHGIGFSFNVYEWSKE